MFTYSF